MKQAKAVLSVVDRRAKAYRRSEFIVDTRHINEEREMKRYFFELVNDNLTLIKRRGVTIGVIVQDRFWSFYRGFENLGLYARRVYYARTATEIRARYIQSGLIKAAA